MFTTEVTPVVEKIPRRICAAWLRRRYEAVGTVGACWTAGDVVLRRAGEARGTAAPERRAGGATIYFDTGKAGAVSADCETRVSHHGA
jgi:ethanolamine ammonia-lyase large subunit